VNTKCHQSPEGTTRLEQMKEEADVLLLVKLLKKIVFNFEEQKNVVEAMLSADENFHRYRQGNDLSNDSYYGEFE